MLESFSRKLGRASRILRTRAYAVEPVPGDYHKKISSESDGNDLIKAVIAGPNPAMISRLGAAEVGALSYYLRARSADFERAPRKKLLRIRAYPAAIAEGMRINAGFFPATTRLLDRFCELYLETIRDVDIMGVWFNAYENVICRAYCENADLVPLRSLEPYYHQRPWSAALRDKTVVVIHPFAGTIESQFRNRIHLFKDDEVVPRFDLITVRAVQSIAGAQTPYATWFEALDAMKETIAGTDFDVAIIGAGAYGLPLASFVKRLGKKALHLGGATQILFGIKGRRWDTHEIISGLYNEYWVRPGAEDTPIGFEKVEEGCYW